LLLAFPKANAEPGTLLGVCGLAAPNPNPPGEEGVDLDVVPKPNDDLVSLVS